MQKKKRIKAKSADFASSSSHNSSQGLRQLLADLLIAYRSLHALVAIRSISAVEPPSFLIETDSKKPASILPTAVVANLRALTPCSNKVSSSPYVLPLGSGRRKKVHVAQHKAVPAQKKPVFAPQPHAVGLSMRGVRMLATMLAMLYMLRANTTDFARRRVDVSSATSE